MDRMQQCCESGVCANLSVVAGKGKCLHTRNPRGHGQTTDVSPETLLLEELSCVHDDAKQEKNVEGTCFGSTAARG